MADKSGLRCAITDLTGCSTGSAVHGSEAAAAREAKLQIDLRRWIADGIDFVQLREKHLEAGELLVLAQAAVRQLREPPAPGEARQLPKLLINSRADIATAAGADGVHLTARHGELRPADVRAVFRNAGLARCTVSVSCHTLDDVARASDGGADLLLFSPVFEKRVAGRVVVEGTGLERLHAAVDRAGTVPVLALGGVSPALVERCLQTGAAGVAGIRLFAPSVSLAAGNSAAQNSPSCVRK